MLYNSPKLAEHGSFDIEAGVNLAKRIVKEGLHESYEEPSGRYVLSSDNSEKALGIIGLYSPMQDDVRTRACSQYMEDMSGNFNARKYHIDVDDSNEKRAPKPFDFRFGVTDHGTEVVVGDIDMSDVVRLAHKTEELEEIDFANNLHLLFYHFSNSSQIAVENALASGSASPVILDPGVLYGMPNGSVHRVQPFVAGQITEPRFTIEQYLLPSTG